VDELEVLQAEGRAVRRRALRVIRKKAKHVAKALNISKEAAETELRRELIVVAEREDAASRET
jgi:hypothetical protein